MAIRRIDLKRFSALAARTQSPAAAFATRELDCFSNDHESRLATLILDTVDDDYVGIVLGRDEASRYRYIYVQSSIPRPDEALSWIERTIAWHGREAQKVFSQGDAAKQLDLFTPVVSYEKMHPSFAKLRQSRALDPARRQIAKKRRSPCPMKTVAEFDQMNMSLEGTEMRPRLAGRETRGCFSTAPLDLPTQSAEPPCT